MPYRNHPMTLRETCIRKVREIWNGILEDWITTLRLAGNKDIWIYRQRVKEVMDECKTLNERMHGTSLSLPIPLHVLDDLIPQLVSDFLKKILSYHNTILRLTRIRKHAKQTHADVCIEMLKSVLGLNTRRINTGTMSSFELRLVIKTFNSIPNLSHLVFGISPGIDSRLLAINIYQLRHLVSFQFSYRCTDQVIRRLALHCNKLRKIDVSQSRAVTQVSVKHLLKLKVLCSLDLTGTSVTDIRYTEFKSRFPNITIKHHSFTNI
jgi:hypothetical protein